MTPTDMKKALERAGLADTEVEERRDGYTVRFENKVAQVFRLKSGQVTIVVRGSRTTLPVGATVGQVARAISMALRPTLLTYRDVAGRELYVVRNTLGDRPDSLVLSTGGARAVEIAARFHHLSPKSFTASAAGEEAEGRFHMALFEDGRLYPLEDVFRAMSVTR